MLVDADIVQKTMPGGREMTHRALVVVGNLNGCAGFGIGKGENADDAKDRAIIAAKKNFIYVDLFRGRCITQPLYGKHNNCRVYIQAGDPRMPSMEGRMVNDILRVFGVECGEARSVGNRNPYSVVRAVFNAMSKHKSLETIARTRGRRLISLYKQRQYGL